MKIDTSNPCGRLNVRISVAFRFGAGLFLAEFLAGNVLAQPAGIICDDLERLRVGVSVKGYDRQTPENRAEWQRRYEQYCTATGKGSAKQPAAMAGGQSKYQTMEKLACVQRGVPYKTFMYKLPIKNTCSNRVEAHYFDGERSTYVLLEGMQEYKLDGAGAYETAKVPVLTGECIILPAGKKRCNKL